jgi:hypothetical protein
VLSLIASQCLVLPGRADIGLNMKFDRRNLQLPGYARRRPDGAWEYSEDARSALVAYKAVRHREGDR